MYLRPMQKIKISFVSVGVPSVVDESGPGERPPSDLLRQHFDSARQPLLVAFRRGQLDVHAADQGHAGGGRRHLPVPSDHRSHQQNHRRRRFAGASAADHRRQLDQSHRGRRGTARAARVLRRRLPSAQDLVAQGEQRHSAHWRIHLQVTTRSKTDTRFIFLLAEFLTCACFLVTNKYLWQ